MRFATTFSRFFFLSILLLGGWCCPGRVRAQAVPPGEGLVADATELQALREFYQATGGPGWTTRTNWEQGTTLADAATWYGVQLVDGDVRALRLNSNHLTGAVPAALGQLTELRELHLAGNALTALPDELAQCMHLEQFYAHYNQLSGALPAWLGALPALTNVSLGHNRFTGALPAAWAALGQLRALDVAANQLAGPLPTWLGQWAQLEEFAANDNGFAGPLPAALGQGGALQVVSLQGNQLAGALPPSWGQWHALRYLNLERNQLGGEVPDALVAGWGALTHLELSHNRFGGPLPAALGGLSALFSFGADDNAFEGGLPAEWGSLARLWRLSLSGNRLVGTIPGQWGQLSNLRQFFLNDNRLEGSLPDGLANITFLDYLCVSHNRLTGAIPAAYAGFHRLYQLDLSGNQLSGAVPEGLKAALCYLQDNHLSGRLPASYGTTENWIFLLDHNDITWIPDFNRPLGWPGLQLGLTNNFLAFDSYEPNQVTPGVYQHWDYGQRTPGPANTVEVLPGATPTLDGRIGGAHNVYQWQRQVGGQWADVPGATQAQWTLPPVDPADRGAYRTRVTNTWVVGIELHSRTQELDLVPYPPLARNLPVDANTGPALVNNPPPAPATAPEDMNYVRTFTPRVALTDEALVAPAGVDQVAVSTQYLDGLGRPVQTVQRQASPQRRDLVQPMAYDALGREVRQYLPYAAAGTAAGDYRPQALGEQYQFYQPTGVGPLAPTDARRGVVRTGVPYAETLFETSPLNRVRAQAAPGEDWQLTSGHVQSRVERPNVDADAVQRFAPGYGTSAADPAWRALGWAGAYPAGELWGTVSYDEQVVPAGPGGQGYATIEWKDKQGQVVLKQVEASRERAAELGGAGEYRSRWLRTYYVYDDFGHLRAVLPPEATKVLEAQGWAGSAAAERLLFRYRYDARGRVVAKQVPGTDGETVLVYDPLDRPVLSQDAAQRARQEWAWTKYDALGRVVLTGLVARNATAEDLQGEADPAGGAAGGPASEARTPDGGRYPQFYTTDGAYPPLGQGGFGAGQVLSAAYYDDYDFDNNGAADARYDPQSDRQFAGGPAPVADAQRVRGLPTRTQTRVLGVAAGQPGAWLTATTFYDERARPVQVQSTNARGGADLVTSRLSFAGQVEQSVAVHEGPNHAPVQVVETMTYDHAGRLLTTRQHLPGEAAPALLAQLDYNELGQLRGKALGTAALAQQVDYAYNARGWLTGLNNPDQPRPGDLFNLSLHYNTGFTGGYEQYNGNITGQKWRGRDGVERAYGYVYDPLSRLLQGDFVARASGPGAATGPWTGELDNYRLSFVSYDDNGNIQTLRRRGLLAGATHATPKRYGAVDNLAYAYQGNRLLSVQDAVTSNALPRPAGYGGAPASLAGDFQEQGVRQSQEYFYDANGNTTQDGNKGLTDIRYNFLNLPERVSFSATDYVEFRYAASGQKVAKLVYQTGQSVQRTDYLGPYQYEGDSLRFFPHAEGRVLRTVSGASGQVSYEREYTVKDHLGNLRLAYRLGQTPTYVATLEQDPSTHERERRQFDDFSVSAPVAQNVGAGLARTGSYAAKLNAGGSAPQPLGPLLQLGVQKGDVVTVTAPGRYEQPVSNPGFFAALGAFVAGLLHPAGPTPPGPDPGAGRRGLPLLQLGVAAGLTQLPQVGGGVPKGYLRVLVFNKDSALVDQQVRPLSQAALHGYEELRLQLTLAQDGYVTAYVGNESDVDVLFDDVRVEHRQGLQVQENQYEPWGQSLAGLDYSSPGIKLLNQYQFNGKERQNDLGLGWSDYGARLYDGQLGRWHGVDPAADKFQGLSPYSYCADSPVLLSDPDGRDWSITYTEDAKGRVNWNITFTAAVLNSSQKSINTANFIKQQKAEFSRIFGGNHGGQTVTATFDARSISSVSELKSNEHLIDIMDAKQFSANVAGQASYGGKLIELNSNYIDSDGSSQDNRALSHEIGHSGGLWHPFAGQREDGELMQGFNTNPLARSMRFLNGKPTDATYQAFSPDDAGYNIQLDNNFMTYLGQARINAPEAYNDVYLRTNPGRATTGQVKQILKNYYRGNLNSNSDLKNR